MEEGLLINFELYVAGTNRITQAVLGAHDGGVFSLCSTKDGNLLSGGGKDRKVIEWDGSYSKTGRETEVLVTAYIIQIQHRVYSLLVYLSMIAYSGSGCRLFQFEINP